MLIKELWTDDDDARVQSMRHAFATGDLAGALLAAEGCSERRGDETRRRLERWAERVEERLAVPGVSGLEALRRVLVNELHISGEYEDPLNLRNCSLSMTVSSRAGHAFLVSAVWMLVGRLAGIEVSAVQGDQHFLVRVGGEEGVCVDPFRFGRTVETGRRPPRPGSDDVECLPEDDGVTDAQLVERVLAKLARTYSRLEDRDNSYRIARILVELWPERSEYSLEYARLCDEVGAHALAESAYRSVVKRFQGTSDAVQARAQLASRGGTRMSN